MFRKRIYSMREFMRDFLWLRQNSGKAKRPGLSRHISGSFLEKIKLAVTAVNECRYCMAIHTDLARSDGVSETLIKSILGKNAGELVPDFEKTAIEYAYHYAETAQDPDKGMTDGLYSFYGEDEAGEIILHIRRIYFSNLSANTVDAFLNRLKGSAAPGSSLIFELLLFLMVWPQVTMKRYAAKRRAVHAERAKYATDSEHEARG
jgi:AhpD family alkylhydroperoxidase